MTRAGQAELRFDLANHPLLAEVLGIPNKIVCPNRTVGTGMEVLCITSHNVRSHRTNLQQHGNLLTSLNQPRLQEYANAIHSRGVALENCWGFVDGTVTPICRPGQHQRSVYNSHKRVHAIKFQCVVAPNGLVANLYGPTGMHLTRMAK